MADVLRAPLPGTAAPIVRERGLLSDRDGHQRWLLGLMDRFKGQTLGQLMTRSREQLLGRKLARRLQPVSAAAEVPRCARDAFSIQVHPSDRPGTDWSAARRKRQDRGLGGAGGGARKPHLRGPQARSRAPMRPIWRQGALPGNGTLGGPLWPASGHWSGDGVPLARLEPFIHLGGAPCVPEGPAKQRCHVSGLAADLGSRGCLDRPASGPASRSSDGLHRFCAGRDGSSDAGGGRSGSGAAGEAHLMRTFRFVSALWRIAVSSRRRGSSTRAGVSRGRRLV